MLRRWRLKRTHARFLESCRNLKEGREYWANAGALSRWIAETLLPIPHLGLNDDGARLLRGLEWLEENCRQRPLSIQVIRRYHELVYRGPDTPGDFRSRKVLVLGSSIARPAPDKVPLLMKQLDFRLAESQRQYDSASPVDEVAVFDKAVSVYERIGYIHPFGDANGRVARLSMNHLLARYGLGYVILPVLGDSPQLWEALQKAHQGDLGDLVQAARRHHVRV